PSASVALHKHSHALVEVLPPEADSGVSLLSQSEKPDVTNNVSKFYIEYLVLSSCRVC
ncbi:26S proteasome regulatory subunit 6B, partial [Tanacetum coccineum]